MKKIFVLLVIFLIGSVGKVSSQTTPPPTPANVYVPGVCICVTKSYCGMAGGETNTDGAGQIDPRIMTVIPDFLQLSQQRQQF